MVKNISLPKEFTLQHGLLYCSDRGNAKIEEFKLPDSVDDKFYVIKAEDIPGTNAINAFGTTMPLLASSEVLYKGMPICAIFSHDYEAVTLSLRDIQCTYTDREETILGLEMPEDEILQWGEIDDFNTKAELKAIKSEYTLRSMEGRPETESVCTAWQNNNTLFVAISCQWPELVQDSIANVLNIPLENIQIIPQPYYATNDEFLISPVIMGTIAALAVVKGNINVQLKAHPYSRSPECKIERTTYCNSDGKPLAEEVKMNVDLGAYPLAAKEYQRQAITGLLPNYALQAFKASVSVTSSYNPPAGFFGSLGYAEALSVTEAHTAQIAASFHIDPHHWRDLILGDKRRFTDYMPSIDLPVLKKLIDDISMKSFFLRKWSSYNLQNGDFTLFQFSRGIGLACGVGISGFSSTYIKDKNYQFKLTLLDKGGLVIETSLPVNGNSAYTWQMVAQTEMEMDSAQDITIVDCSMTKNFSSGPDVLEIPIGKCTKQLVGGCRRIMQEAKKRPYSILLDVENKYYPCEFENNGAAAIIVEIKIDNISFEPVVTAVWATFVFGRIISKQNLTTSIRQVIMHTLIEAGARIENSTKHPFQIHITLNTDNTDALADMSNAVKGLTRAAFLTAIIQATGKNIANLPVSAGDVMQAINGGNKA